MLPRVDAVARRAEISPSMSDDFPDDKVPSSPPKEPTAAAVLWFTGLSSSGKTTLAEAVATKIRARGEKMEVLDGDAARATFSIGLGFSRADRNMHVLRLAHVAHVLSRNGIFVAVAAISPYRRARAHARAIIGVFVEIHVKTPLEECVRRDVKGLYARALRGEIANFTGISDPYEVPAAPEVEIDTRLASPDESADEIIWRLLQMGYLRFCDDGGRQLPEGR